MLQVEVLNYLNIHDIQIIPADNVLAPYCPPAAFLSFSRIHNLFVKRRNSDVLCIATQRFAQTFSSISRASSLTRQF